MAYYGTCPYLGSAEKVGARFGIAIYLKSY
jgi:hypothetical protein